MFRFLKNNQGQNYPVILQLPAKASTAYVPGQTLELKDGAAVQTATNPQYVCAQLLAASTTPGTVSVYPIYDGQEWKTEFNADAKAVKEGSAVTIDAGFLTVTATTESGVFEIIKKLGDGSKGTGVIGRFIKPVVTPGVGG